MLIGPPTAFVPTRLVLSCLFRVFLSKAALIALGYEEVALDDFWQTFLQELDALPNMEMGQLEVRRAGLAKYPRRDRRGWDFFYSVTPFL